MIEDTKNKIYNIELVVKDIQNFPQTYETILSDCNNDGTCQVILRRKINKLIKLGVICKTSIPGTRFGKAIFYTLPKKYNILVEANRLENKVYCFFNFKRISHFWFVVDEPWLLKNNKWIKKDKKKFFDGNILKWI